MKDSSLGEFVAYALTEFSRDIEDLAREVEKVREDEARSGKLTELRRTRWDSAEAILREEASRTEPVGPPPKNPDTRSPTMVYWRGKRYLEREFRERARRFQKKYTENLSIARSIPDGPDKEVLLGKNTAYKVILNRMKRQGLA